MVNEISWEEASGQVLPGESKTPVSTKGKEISWEEATGSSVQPSLWERVKTSMATSPIAVVEQKAMGGLGQLGQEVKALSNMLVGIPGGVAGVGMDIGSRISSLALGEDAKTAGLRARATAENTNALWGKVTGALGLTQDASGSKIEALMGKGMEMSDVAGAQTEAATGGVVSKETVQSVRDTLLNALGVRGLRMTGMAKGKAIKPGQGTADALSVDAAIKASKARIYEQAQAKAMEEVAAGKAKAETVQKVYEDALKNRHPLGEAWAGKKPETGAGMSPAWDGRVRGLVEPPAMELPQGPGLTPKTRLAEPTVIGQGPDPIITGMDKLRKGLLLSNAEAKAIRRLSQDTPTLDVVEGAVPRATLAERLAEPLPARGPGVVPKTRLAEPVVMGKEAPVPVQELYGVVTSLLDSGLDKLRRGQLISANEAKAVRALKPLPGQGTIVGPDGKPYFQRGAVDPSLLKVLGLMGVGAAAGTALYNWFQSSGEVSGDNVRDVSLGLGAVGAAGVTKFTKGGFWHPETVARLADAVAGERHYDAAVERNALDPLRAWASKSVANYVNKHAGMATDPIKDLKLPDGTKWEDLTDATIHQTLAEKFAKPVEGARSGETVWSIEQASPWGNIRPASIAAEKVQNYLSHVGDWIRVQNFTPAQLQQLDLPRAIRETLANDQRIAAEAVKDFTKPNAARMAETQALPEYKSYPPVEQGKRTFSFNRDGSIREMKEIGLPAEAVQYSWRELKLPEQLTPEQAKTVIAVDSVRGRGNPDYIALDAKGKPIKDNFSEAEARGVTPEEAYLAGQLAKEGNALGHCVGGYVDQVLSGESRIISLRDQNGRSYATVELKQAGQSPYSNQPQGGLDTIAQIKGPGNGAPAKYVEPYVQDFVMSGQWGNVGDLHHAGLVKNPDGSLQTLKERATQELPLLERDLAQLEKLKIEGGYGRRGWTLEELDYNIEQTKQDIAKRRSELGKVDPKLLAGIAAGTAAGIYAYNNPPDKFAALAAGLLGATVMRKAPSRFDAMKTPELVQALQAGGKEAEGAARAIHDSTRGQLERSLYSFKDKIDVEQAVQDAYTNTFEAVAKGEFKGEAELSTYLHRAAKNAALNQMRARDSRPKASSVSSIGGPDGEVMDVADTLSSEATRTPEQLVSNQQMIGKMQAAIEKLPEDQRSVFELAEIDGLPYEDIAAQLDVPIGTVRSRLARAREGLQKSLREYKPERQAGKVDENLLQAAGLATGGAIIGANMAGDGSNGAIVGALTGLLAKGLYGTGPGRAAVMRGTTRLMEVLPELRRSARDMELAASKEVSAASEAISALIKPTKKLSKEQYTKLDAAYATADAGAFAETIKGNPELVAGYAKVREFLRKTETQLKSFGRFKEGIPDYLPLMVKDYKGLMEVLGHEVKTGLEDYISKANLKSLKDRGTGLNEVEKSLLVNDYLIRDPATSYLPAFAKRRRLKMIEQTRPFYHTMEDALIHYAHAAVEDIAEAKFFGKDLRTSKRDGQLYTNLDNSIGALTHRAIEEGRMTTEQAVEVQAVLRARFGKGKQAPSGWLQDIRNASGVALLGQIGSGLVQTSEGLLSIYHHGIRPAVEAAGMLIARRGIKPAEFGLANHVIEEVIGKRPTGVVLSKVLKLNLLASLDQLGMSQNLTASFIKNKRLAQTASGQAKLMEKWGKDYGPDMPQLIEELKGSTTKARTPLVDSLLYQELSDVRPTSRMEATELYNVHPNARMMYHLKQFMLTQADIMYRDSAKKIASGNPKQVAVGLKNLALYSAALSVAIVPSDAIKNWMMGRGLKLNKIDYVDNFVRNFGLSRYTMDKIGRSKEPIVAMSDAGQKMLTPPALSVLKTLGKGAVNPKELVPLIPGVGRIIYNRELGGNEKAAANDKAQARLDLRDAREARNPALKAARLRKAEQAKRKAEARANYSR